MNEQFIQALKPFVLHDKHYLFESSGQIVVGYFPWRGSVIVALFDASHDDSFDDIDRHSNIRLLSVELARQDWNERVQGKKTFEWITSLPGRFSVENKLKNIAFALAIQFRDNEDEDFKRVADDSAYVNDTQYALRA